MRRALMLLLIALTSAPNVPAKNIRNWENAKKLKPGTPVQVILWTGEQISGELDAVTDTDLRLYTSDRTAPQSQWQRSLNRPDIHRIVRYRQASDLPNLHKWLAIGAGTGAVVGIGVGAARDAKAGNSGRFLIGGLAGAALGFAASCLVLAVATTAHMASHQGYAKLVYEDTPPPPATTIPQQFTGK